MPKIKTKKGLAKRVIKKPNGTLKRGKAYRSHLAQNKSKKQKRHLAKSSIIHKTDAKRMKGLI